MKKVLLIAVALLSLSACKQKNKDIAAPAAKPDAEAIAVSPSADKTVGDPIVNSTDNAKEMQADAVPSETAAVQDTSKKIVKEGSIEFEVGDLNTTRKKLLTSLKKYGGYVDEDNQSTNGDNNRKEYNLKIRVPEKYFDFVLDSVSSAADKIDSKNITSTDVTTQYIDIKTRLDNKKILEGRYLELLKRTSKVSDLLDIENKLTEIRSDIESTQGQLNYLSRQVAYSSLNITFYTRQIEKADKGTGFGYKLKTAIADGWGTLQGLFFSIISLWPLVLLAGIIYWAVRVWRRKRVVKAE